MSECVILVGLPGAGKTTFFRRYFAATHQLISKDLWPNATAKESRQQRLLDETLARGVSAVVDNTNPSAADRARIISIARTHGATVVGYVFAATTREAVARNAGRQGRGRVPNVAIFTTAKRFERPTFAEGFDQLFEVRAENGAFRVAELT